MESESDSSDNPKSSESEWLDKLIGERKTDFRTKARNKLLKNREQIRALNSSPENGIDAVMILPKEIWAMILEEVKDAETVESAWRTCNLFKELLDTRRLEEVLLPSVFQVLHLLDLLEESDDDGDDDEESEVGVGNSSETGSDDDEGSRRQNVSENEDEEVQPEEVLSPRPDILEEPDEEAENNEENNDGEEKGRDENEDDGELTYPRILQIRKICKSWRKGFDLSIQRHLLNSAPRKLLCHHISSGENLDKFTEGMRLFRRAVKVTIPCNLGTEFVDHPGPRKPLNDLRSSVLEFLRVAGPQILSFEYGVSNLKDFFWRYYAPYELAYLILPQMLELAPNVASLIIDMRTDIDYEDFLDDLERFDEFVSKNPVPTLNSVGKLHLRIDSNLLNRGKVRPFLYNNLLSSCPNVTDLFLDCDDADYGSMTKLGKIAESVRSLKHLKSFKLVTYSRDEKGFHEIEDLFNEDWKLRYLHLGMDYGFSREPVGGRLFDLLAKYSETLERVELGLESAEPLFAEIGIQLNLPNVTHFRIETDFVDFWNSLDFLLPMVNLEYLEVAYETQILRRPECEKKTAIKFLNGRREWDLERAESNVWDVFPALKTVVIRIEDCDASITGSDTYTVMEFKRGLGKRVYSHN